MERIAIIGGGITGLSLAWFLGEKKLPAEVTVFESEKKPGGKIWTDKSDGFLCEGGVNGFLDNRPKTIELSRQVSLEPLRSNDAARKRFVFSGHVLHRLPESPPAFLTSPLLSLAGRIRVIAELLVPGSPSETETLQEFAIRRLGKEAYEKLIDPMASGIYAGNPENLSLKACFPKVYNLEMNYGGLIKGMIKLQKERKKQGSGEKVGAGPGGTLTSFYQGMQELVDALKQVMGEGLRVNAGVVSLEKKSRGYSLVLTDGSGFEADRVVLACPAHAGQKILENIDSSIAGLLSRIPYPSLSVVCFGYRKDKIGHSLDGFGFLVPSREKRKVLGTLWDSSIFPNRAPEGHVLLRSMIGGARASALAMENDDVLTNITMSEISDIMGIKVDPEFVKIYRHEKAIPQYNRGHLELVKEVEDDIRKHEKLHITGNAFRGIGVNDCIENSYKLAEAIAGEYK